MLAQAIGQARAAGKHVSVCGEMAGDPDFTEVLLAMGLRSLSMHPSQIASIKQHVLRTDARRWAEQLEIILSAADPEAYCKRTARRLATRERAPSLDSSDVESEH